MGQKTNNRSDKCSCARGAAILALLLLTGCASGPAGWRDPGTAIPGLPPDPGPTGLSSLSGVDADQDGTRDDVQRWLAHQELEYGTGQALAEMARAVQVMILHSEEKSTVQQAADRYSLYTMCLLKFDGARRTRTLTERLEQLMLNTAARRAAHARARAHLHEFYGQIHDANHCDRIAASSADRWLVTR